MSVIVSSHCSKSYAREYGNNFSSFALNDWSDFVLCECCCAVFMTNVSVHPKRIELNSNTVTELHANLSICIYICSSVQNRHEHRQSPFMAAVK